MTRHIAAGDEGTGVRDVQRRLARYLREPLSIDGRFGTKTEAAVRRFQQDRGLAADGVVGDETWQALSEAGLSLGDRLLWRATSPMRGDDVRELQQRLNALGFDAGPEDGIFAGAVQAAIEEFQRNVGLSADGVAGTATVAALARLRRDHQSEGLAAAVREREALRSVPTGGLVGARLVIDPAHAADQPGMVAPDGTEEATLTWQIASRVAARINARGGDAVLSRGPNTGPTPSERARAANDQDAAMVVSIGFGGLASTPSARGAATYHFGAPHFTSEAGRRLAEHLQTAVLAAGWGPDCRTHGVTWSILRETRMPAVVCEPAFLTNPDDAARLVRPEVQDQLASALTDGIESFLSPSVTDDGDDGDLDRPQPTAVTG